MQPSRCIMNYTLCSLWYSFIWIIEFSRNRIIQMETEDSQPWSQEPATILCPEPEDSSPYYQYFCNVHSNVFLPSTPRSPFKYCFVNAFLLVAQLWIIAYHVSSIKLLITTRSCFALYEYSTGLLFSVAAYVRTVYCMAKMCRQLKCSETRWKHRECSPHIFPVFGRIIDGIRLLLKGFFF